MKIVAIEPIAYEETFSLEVEHPDHNFILSNGLVSKNSHACAYSVLTYVSAYLKANYPLEFFCSLMSVRSKGMAPKNWMTKAPEYLQDARALGITINPPSINGSHLDFSIKDNEIYFGFNAIRDVGVTAAKSIVAARGNKPFTDVFDFLNRVNLQKVSTKTFTSLVKAGAFDKLGYLRSELEDNTQALYDYVHDTIDFKEKEIAVRERTFTRNVIDAGLQSRDIILKRTKKEKRAPTEEEQGILDATDGVRRPVLLKLPNEPVPPTLTRTNKVQISLKEILEQAKYIGCFVGTHPTKMIGGNFQEINKLIEGEIGRLCVVITDRKVITTHSGSQMAFLEIEDSTGSAELTIFPRQWGRLVQDSIIESGTLLIVEAKVEQDDPVYKLIANKIEIYKG